MRTRKEVRNDDVRRVYDFFWSLSYVLALPHDGFSAALPKSTQKILKDLKLDPSILDGVDKELQVPKALLDTPFPCDMGAFEQPLPALTACNLL